MTRIVADVHERFRDVTAGMLADYIPELTRADPSDFGLVIVTTDGQPYAVGDVGVPFTIQSVSKAFVYGLALETHGAAAVEQRVDVEPSGEAFNSISLDDETGRPRNPMINAGAIAVTGMIPDEDAGRFERIRRDLSRLAGQDLDWDREVYASESRTGHRNRAIAHLLRGAGVIDDDPDGICDDYFRQCAMRVTALDLATMAASLAAGGTHPTTGDRVLSPGTVEKVLSVMGTCGMYDYSGTWMYEVGIPAKSGVGGGVVGVLPGALGFAAFSPLLDVKGNSVRGVAALRELSDRLDLHLMRAGTSADHAVRRVYRLSDVAATRRRQPRDRELLTRLGGRVMVVEMQGDLFTPQLERLVREVQRGWTETDRVVVDLTRAGSADGATVTILRRLASDLGDAAKMLVIADPGGLVGPEVLEGTRAVLAADADEALLNCEEFLLSSADRGDAAEDEFELEDFELTRWLGSHDVLRLAPRFEEVFVEPGDLLVEQGTESDAIWLLASGRARVELSSGPDEPPRRLADLYPGTVFGELGVLQRQPRSASVRALTATRSFVLSRDALMDVRRTDHLVYTRIVEHLLVTTADRLAQVSREAAVMRA